MEEDCVGGDFLLDYYSIVQGPQKLYRNNFIAIILLP